MGLVEALLALGLLVVVPLALPLHPDTPRWPSAVYAVVAVPAVVGLGLSQSLLAAGLAAPWLVLTGVLTAIAGWRWVTGARSLRTLVWPLALGYLTVGAAWLVSDRLDVEPAGVVAPFVALTAVHFAYAGFTATLLAALAWRRMSEASPRASAVMVAAVAGAPPIVAAGFTLAGPLQIVGAVVLTAGLFMLADLTRRHLLPTIDDGGARALLAVSAIAVLVPMVLAVQWAVGWNYGTPALSIPVMARTHGVVNAIGFALCGVWGWRRVG